MHLQQKTMLTIMPNSQWKNQAGPNIFMEATVFSPVSLCGFACFTMVIQFTKTGFSSLKGDIYLMTCCNLKWQTDMDGPELFNQSYLVYSTLILKQTAIHFNI